MRSRVVIGTCFFLVVLVALSLLPGRAQMAVLAQGQGTAAGSGAPPLSNPLKVALLKSYNANTVPTEFPVGSQPYGVAFDGANIWTANFGDGTVSKMRANDGTLLGTFAAINAPYGVTFDGANIWVSGYGGNVVKLRASDGKNLGSFPVGVAPVAAAFDGANVWVTNQTSDIGPGTVTKLRASDGMVLGTFNVHGTSPYGLAFDGANVWVTGLNNNTVGKL